jgi:hypothetical protein
MENLKDWCGREVAAARSSGGVIALANPWENLMRTGVAPWPTPELIQKVYQSRQARAFKGRELEVATQTLGFYSDLQSIHSEDAITWSMFGPVAHAEPEIRARFADDLLRHLEIKATVRNATLWLWRRLPHPDTLVPGGPEIDFGVQTDDVFLLGEAKWRSSVGAAQGVGRNKDQLTLRREFCEKYGRHLLPQVKRFVVLGVSRTGGLLSHGDTESGGVYLHSRDSTWKGLARLDSNPLARELRDYLRWKEQLSLPG